MGEGAKSYAHESLVIYNHGGWRGAKSYAIEKAWSINYSILFEHTPSTFAGRSRHLEVTGTQCQVEGTMLQLADTHQMLELRVLWNKDQ
jgi:hypothetical protein